MGKKRKRKSLHSKDHFLSKFLDKKTKDYQSCIMADFSEPGNRPDTDSEDEIFYNGEHHRDQDAGWMSTLEEVSDLEEEDDEPAVLVEDAVVNNHQQDIQGQIAEDVNVNQEIIQGEGDLQQEQEPGANQHGVQGQEEVYDGDSEDSNMDVTVGQNGDGDNGNNGNRSVNDILHDLHTLDLELEQISERMALLYIELNAVRG